MLRDRPPTHRSLECRRQPMPEIPGVRACTRMLLELRLPPQSATGIEHPHEDNNASEDTRTPRGSRSIVNQSLTSGGGPFVLLCFNTTCKLPRIDQQQEGFQYQTIGSTIALRMPCKVVQVSLPHYCGHDGLMGKRAKYYSMDGGDRGMTF